MKKILVFLSILISLHFNSNTNAQSGWIKQPVNTLKTIYAVYFLNTNTGWAVGDSSQIFYTTNSGSNWIKQVYYISKQFYAVYFKNPLTGWIGGNDASNHHDGFVLKTTNGGNQWTWYTVSSPYEIFSFGGDTIWMATIDGNVLRSTDSGNNWISYYVRSECELYTVNFINSLTGWTGGGVYQGWGYIYKTTNAGLNWVNQFQVNDLHVKSIYFLNDQTGFAVARYGYIYKTTDGGNIWISEASGVNTILYSVGFTDNNTGYTAGFNGAIIKTTNCGLNWNMQILPSNISSATVFFDMQFLSNSTGWAVGDSGTIIKTTNGGNLIGIQKKSSEVPAQFSLSQNYPNPFNPTTLINYQLPVTDNVKLVIYDIMGKEVTTLVNEKQSAGTYEVEWNASGFASGVYFYRLVTDKFSETKKMLLVK